MSALGGGLLLLLLGGGSVAVAVYSWDLEFWGGICINLVSMCGHACIFASERRYHKPG